MTTRPISNRSMQAFFAAATAAVVLAAGVAAWRGVASPLEAVSFVTGAACVWLTVRENVWNFPLGLLNVATFFFVFSGARLYADAGLQVVYFGFTALGWYRWLYGGANRSALRVSRSAGRQLAIVGALGAVGTFVLWQIVARLGGSSSFWDALTTSGSLCAQWLTNEKRLESWAFWIGVDLIYVPLYVSKGLYLTAILYTVFLAMAVMGHRAWRENMR